MARSGVTYAEIARAARALSASGQEPTVERVRQWLGTGSNSTIAPLLKRWRTQKDEIRSAELPDDLVEALRGLQERVQSAAEKHIELTEAEFEARLEEMQLQWNQSQQSAAKLAEENARLQERLNTVQADNERLGRVLEDARIAAARTEIERDQATSQLTAVKAAAAEEKRRNDALQERFEHYQQCSAEERQQEREVHRLATQHYQQQVHQLVEQLKKAEGRFDQLQSDYQQQQANLVQQRDELLAVQDKYTRLKADMEALMLRLREMITERDEIKKANEQLQDRAAALTGDLAVAKAREELFVQQLAESRSSLENTARRVAALQEEQSATLQEKAVIQGQLKELQSQISRSAKGRASK